MRVPLSTKLHPDRLKAAIHTQFCSKLFKRQARVITDQLVEPLTLPLSQNSLSPHLMSLRLERSEIAPLVLKFLHDLVADRKPSSDLRHAFITFKNGRQDPFTQIHT